MTHATPNTSRSAAALPGACSAAGPARLSGPGHSPGTPKSFRSSLGCRRVPAQAHRLERLEPYEGKLSRTVLRGGRAGNSPPPFQRFPPSAPVLRLLSSDLCPLSSAARLLLILLGSAHGVVNEVSVSQQLARRDRHFLHAGNNPERANAAQAPAPLGANLRFPSRSRRLGLSP